MNKLVEEQLKKADQCDLTNFDEETNSYFIPKRKDIKLEIDKCYLFHLKPTLFHNDTLRLNWNAGSLPTKEYLKGEITKIMGKMIRVIAVGYDNEKNITLNYFWNGWLTLADIEVIGKI